MGKTTMLGAAMCALVLMSCSSNASQTDENQNGADETVMSTDLQLYELQGPVKESTKTTYFDVRLDGENFVIDSVGKNIVSSTARFDRNGQYVAKENEKIKRDENGRIVRWEDHRPNVGKVPGGLLKDTLEYKYLNPNHIVSRGMGGYAIVVYDNNKIVGQYTEPSANHSQTSAFNVYKKFDKNGNWTERVTIWSTKGRNDSIPAVKYSIDRRDITYY